MSGFYALLGVSRRATMIDMQTAFRQKALQLHPDRGGNKEAFQKLQEAYQTLSDSQQRARYDAGLASQGVQPSTQQQTSQNRAGFHGQRRAQGSTLDLRSGNWRAGKFANAFGQ
eukprot:TRINITY_DN32775_c0_g1_i1.p1 TRINITY_DN32775_c0_g1~~TRINITY_DN32775_c0_g1_i1.p1  ORF type:complete len:114 (-),score=16.95 TRINITY_DN32775_c0_g1_i1:578-919(-)